MSDEEINNVFNIKASFSVGDVTMIYAAKFDVTAARTSNAVSTE